MSSSFKKNYLKNGKFNGYGVNMLANFATTKETARENSFQSMD
jgi:hypothetical protein